MAEKVRCISNAILYNDNFIRLPNSAKVLYTYINNETDDAGFCDHVAVIMREVGAKAADLRALVDKKYLIQINEWLFLEKHFFINNRGLRRDRLKVSRYAEYLEEYTLKENGAYTLAANWRQIDDKLTQFDTVREEKRSEEKRSEFNLTEWKERQEKEKEAINAAFRNQLTDRRPKNDAAL